MTEQREQLIQAAEAAYQKYQERWARFRAFCVSHLGPSGAEQAEAIISSCFSGLWRALPRDQFHLLVHFTLGLPPLTHSHGSARNGH